MEPKIGLITIGGCDAAVREAADILATRDCLTDVMRIRGFPFDESVEKFVHEHDSCFVIEQNRDAQLRSLLLLEIDIQKDELRSILVYGGFPLSPKHVVEEVQRQLSVKEKRGLRGAEAPQTWEE